MRALSVAKFEENIINEDAALAKNSLIAVSDGAGGGGVFAELWSEYLIKHLPDEPITGYGAFDSWIDGIWEPFYNDCEMKAQKEGGMLLDKFYDEGSFATLVVVWKGGEWMSYGDSVAFCYDRETGELQHSFGRIVEFNQPPYLVNCKDPTNESGFKTGQFEIRKRSVMFVASDTLAHYILMMYEVSRRDKYAEELQEALNAQTKDSNFIRSALSMKTVDFEKDVLKKLMNCNNTRKLKRHLQSLRKKGLIGHDDYSIAIM